VVGTVVPETRIKLTAETMAIGWSETSDSDRDAGLLLLRVS